MSEQELKLHVPAASRQAVQREIKQLEATRIRLHAMYFDTPERNLRVRASPSGYARKAATGCRR